MTEVPIIHPGLKRLIDNKHIIIHQTSAPSHTGTEIISCYERVKRLDEEYFQKHKIRKEDLFVNVEDAPDWLEDEFAIYDVVENDKLPVGKVWLFPYDIYRECLSDIDVYGMYMLPDEIKGKYKKVLMFKGVKE